MGDQREPKESLRDPKKGTKETTEPTTKQKGKQNTREANMFPKKTWRPLTRATFGSAFFKMYTLATARCYILRNLRKAKRSHQIALGQGTSRQKGAEERPMGPPRAPKEHPWASQKASFESKSETKDPKTKIDTKTHVNATSVF